MNNARMALIAGSALALTGCIGTVVDVATAPVRAVGQMADWATVSQDEADRERGREIRRREERLGELHEDYADAREDCLDGSSRRCREAVELRAEMDAIIPTIPVEAEDD